LDLNIVSPVSQAPADIGLGLDAGFNQTLFDAKSAKRLHSIRAEMIPAPIREKPAPVRTPPPGNRAVGRPATLKAAKARANDRDSLLCIHPRASKSLNIRRAIKSSVGC